MSLNAFACPRSITWFAVLALSAPAAAVETVASLDGQASQASSSMNYGDCEVAQVSDQSQAQFEYYLRFVVDGPDTTLVDTALLQLNMQAAPAEVDIDVFGTFSVWLEGDGNCAGDLAQQLELSWDHRPAILTGPVSATVGQNDTSVVIDVTSLLLDTCGDFTVNFGIRATGDACPIDECPIVFHTREASNSGDRPVLDVTYCTEPRGCECTPPQCTWDCGDSDGNVGITDFLALLGQWDGPGSCDFDGGGVGINDFLKLLANWGKCPP